MTEEQQAAVEALREQGYAICLWSPSELEGCNPEAVEDIAGTHGDQFIAESAQ